MRSAEVYYNGELAGILTEESRQQFRFRYDDSWWTMPDQISNMITAMKKSES